MDAPRDVTVIGAGIVGMAAAVALQRDGHTVTVIDSLAPGRGCSYGHGGAISPGQCIPFALPGMLHKIPGWILDPLGPMAVRWRYFPRALPWLLRWALAGRMDRVRAYSAALNGLHAPTLDGYRDILGTDTFADLFRVQGHLYLWSGSKPNAKDRISQELRETHGVRAEALDAEAIRRMEPDLAPVFQRGLFFPDNGHVVNPLRLVETLAEGFLEGGGTIRRGRVEGFEMGPDGPRALQTDAGELPVDRLVISAGAWSNRLTAKLGTRVPLETERGYHVMLPNPGVRLTAKIMNRDHMFGATLMEHGLRLSGTVEIAGVDAPPDYHRAHAVLERGRRMLPGLNDEGAEVWMGCRPSFPDSLPVIDRSPRFPSVFFAFGHGHTGMIGAPMTARLITDLIGGRPPCIDPAPYAVNRF